MHPRLSFAGTVLVFAVSVFVAGEASAAPLERYGVDDGVFRSLQQVYPVAADRLARGEALMQSAKTAADIEKAIALFDEGIAASPSTELIRRRKCQALAILGRHADAIKACDEALHARTTSALAARATVGALLSGAVPPTGNEISMAYVHSYRASQMLSSEPAGHAGRCDIAEKLGDIEMLKACIRDLNRIAPSHPETLRAQAFLTSMQPGRGTLAAWIGLLLLCFVTGVHALLRRRARSVSAAGAALVLLFAAPRTALADTNPPDTNAPAADEKAPRAGYLSKYAIDETNPVESVPSAETRDANPIEYGYFIMDLADHADWAIRDGDHKKAARLYQALIKAVPDVPVGYVKACEQFEILKDLPSAINTCAGALTAKGVTLADYSHYARLVLQKKSLTATDISNLDGVIQHLKAQAGAQAVALDIECTLGAHESDRTRLEDCAPKLAELSPNDPKTLFYEWALAIRKKDFASAESWIAKAKHSAAAKDEVAQMERATVLAMPVWRRGLHALRDWRVGAAFTLVLAASLALMLMRRRAVPPEASV